MTEMTVQPTGECFDDAIELFAVFAANKRVPVHLCHGICYNESNGSLYSHAWVERQDRVYFAGIVDGKKFALEASIPEFYEKFTVTGDVTKYTLDDLLQLPEIENKKSGPWEERYIALTKDGEKKDNVG